MTDTTPGATTAPSRFGTVLIANRGEIACRVIDTLRRMGIRSVAVYSDADRGARHVALADEAVLLGAAAPAASYLNVDRVIAAARVTGADAIHPGYGFLSENIDLARACAAVGIAFIGPGERALDVMADKIRAKNHVAAAGVPVIEGVTSDDATDDSDLIARATALGFPLLVKPSAGGGGKGMQVVSDASQLPDALATARRVALAAFGDDTMLIERFISAPRHIEVQVLADSRGHTIHLGERECSLQRRHQKVIEEAPSPLLDAATRERIGDAAVTVARSVDYTGAGTVEFLVADDRPDEFFFMEMNTRLQVEHPVTELVTGIDLVEWQVRIAAGEPLTLAQESIVLNGHAIEARVYAEDPERGFLPSTGRIAGLREPAGPGVRVDTSLTEGLVVPPDYDPMLSKVIAWGEDRDTALTRLDAALADTSILGVRTNVEYLRLLLADDDVRAGHLDTTLIESRLDALDFADVTDELIAAAALFAMPDAGDTVWTSRSGWRMDGTREPVRVVLEVAGERHEARVGDGTVTVGETHIRARRISDSHVEVDGVTVEWHTARDGGTLWLGRDGTAWPITVIPRERELADTLAAIERESRPASPEVRSPMPGTVVTVSAATGQAVAAGDTLVTIEAMKMEHRLTAPIDGVATVTVAPGDLVKLDQIVATVSAAADEARGDAGDDDHSIPSTHKEES